MKIVSFNIQHCASHMEGKKIDYDLFSRTIREMDADIVGLNEVYGKGELPEFVEQAEILSKGSGMEHFFFAPAIMWKGNNPYGNAMLSKCPILRAENIPVPDPVRESYSRGYESRCLIKAKLANGLTVLVIHFGLHLDEQENAVRTVLENLESEKCVLMGDFNVRPDNPLLDPIRARMVDTAQLSDDELLTFPSDAPERKIDYIFLSPDLKATKVEVPACTSSDHRPYVIEIE
ncbi:MAG: endonuclease/exonuclease/phosphatase family protein [Clostridia bacterium]|nr:endonuclease/exonuclease/phosphatase family protein [Clostridia bacterium]